MIMVRFPIKYQKKMAFKQICWFELLLNIVEPFFLEIYIIKCIASNLIFIKPI